MEKEAKEKRQRRIEEAKKLERQLQRDHVALKKYRQRQEIYALNKVMTELEHKHFHEFCEQMKNVSNKESDRWRTFAQIYVMTIMCNQGGGDNRVPEEDLSDFVKKK